MLRGFLAESICYGSGRYGPPRRERELEIGCYLGAGGLGTALHDITGRRVRTLQRAFDGAPHDELPWPTAERIHPGFVIS